MAGFFHNGYIREQQGVSPAGPFNATCAAYAPGCPFELPDRLGVKPAEIKYVAVSHTHPDHIGNISMFPQSTLLVQKAEYEWPSPFARALQAGPSAVNKLEGDHDVFSDGSVMLIAPPGHTPGHQSLLIKLP
jgi:N-acyl homoserine lactone hydrolase